MTRARASLAALSALAVAALSAVAFPAPASAAPLGTVKLSQSKGTVEQTPIVGTASASKPCPDGYGADAQVRIGPPGGPYQNVATPLRAGGYDKKAVSVKPNRSFARAIGGAPANGEWWVVVECYSLTLGQHRERFITPLTVAGKEWKVGQPVGGASLDSPPPPQAVVPTSGPTGTPAPGATTGPAPSAPSSTGAPAPDPELASNNRSGSGSPLASVMWVGGVILVLAIVGAIALLTRRRRPS